VTPDPFALIAILRGVRPEEVCAVGDTLYGAGFRSIEVPLNSPDPFASIEALRGHLPQDALVGAGTVFDPADVGRAHGVGAQTIVSPHTDPEVVAETVRRGMRSYPGAATPSDAFAALRAGTRRVKVFPSQQVGPGGLKAWREVLPPDVELLPVGGVGAGSMAGWVAAGATGFGVGSALYRAGRDVADLGTRAAALVEAWHACTRDAHEEGRSAR
jgi:2-dehydro-3-deoxyphosphogalactonate aldolase